MQYYGKQATTALERVLSRDDVQRSSAHLQRQKDFDELQKAVRFLEIYSSILNRTDSIDILSNEHQGAAKDLAILLDKESQSELPMLLEQSFKLGENLLQTQQECDIVADKLEETILDTELLDLARTPN